MEVQKKYAYFDLTRENISDIEQLLHKFGSDSYSYSLTLYYEDEKISIDSKEEFINVTNLKGLYPQSYSYYIKGKKKIKNGNYEHTDTIYTINLITFYGGPVEASVDASEAKNAYLVLSEIEKFCNLKKPVIKKEEAQKRKTVFVAHSFDKKGKIYGQTLGKFLQLLGFDVKSGEKYSPKKVDEKIKERLSEQEILMTIYSPKLDYTWLHQESGGGVFADKPISVFKETGVKVREGIFKGKEYLSFPSGNIEKTFVRVLEGLEEIGYW